MKPSTESAASLEHQDETPFPVDPVIEAYKNDIDRTLLRTNLKLSLEQRLEQLMELPRFARALNKSRSVKLESTECAGSVGIR